MGRYSILCCISFASLRYLIVDLQQFSADPYNGNASKIIFQKVDHICTPSPQLACPPEPVIFAKPVVCQGEECDMLSSEVKS